MSMKDIPQDYHAFYQTLSPLEQSAWKRLHAIFQNVHPQKPEKGIKALILRARETARQQNIALEIALETILAGATERTERRVQLLQQCRLQAVHPTELN